MQDSHTLKRLRSAIVSRIRNGQGSLESLKEEKTRNGILSTLTARGETFSLSPRVVGPGGVGLLKVDFSGDNSCHAENYSPSRSGSFSMPASDERGMVRHYPLSVEDIALINRHRGDSNRLGFAVMLCYLRFPVSAES
jgi:hypothetical protein